MENRGSTLSADVARPELLTAPHQPICTRCDCTRFLVWQRADLPSELRRLLAASRRSGPLAEAGRRFRRLAPHSDDPLPWSQLLAAFRDSAPPDSADGRDFFDGVGVCTATDSRSEHRFVGVVAGVWQSAGSSPEPRAEATATRLGPPAENNAPCADFPCALVSF